MQLRDKDYKSYLLHRIDRDTSGVLLLENIRATVKHLKAFLKIQKQKKPT